jgi:hypothetical protein
LPRSFLMIRPCQPIQATVGGARRSGVQTTSRVGPPKKRVGPLATNCWSRWFPTHRGDDGVRRDGKRNNGRGRRRYDRNRRANNCQKLHREPSSGHDELPSGRHANGSSRLFPSVSELGTGAVATQNFHCRRSALLANCWRSCTHLHAYRDARGCVDRDLRVQGSTCRLRIRGAQNFKPQSSKPINPLNRDTASAETYTQRAARLERNSWFRWAPLAKFQPVRDFAASIV